MRRQVKRAEDLIGKTIKRIEDFSYYANEYMLVKFTDGTFAFLESEASHDGDKYSPSVVDDDRDSPHALPKLKAAGLLDPDEEAAFLQAAETQRARASALSEERERAEYERLKAKFDRPVSP